jgi:L-asparaginase/Glu-tRNA(Gln) amidotransferase subunit D
MSHSKPQIHVIGTGGTIAGIGPDRLDYTQYAELGKKLSIEQSLQRIPQSNDIANIECEDLISVGSPAIGPTE